MGVDLASLQALLGCRNAAELGQVASRLLADLGVEHWVYAADRLDAQHGTQRQVLGDYPEAWVQHYLARDYLSCDPTVAHCRLHATPITWREARLLVSSKSGTAHAGRLFDEAGEFGLADGMSVPLHGPGIGWGVVSFTVGQRGSDQFEWIAADLYLLAHYLHESARILIQPKRALHPISLSRRERECLSWAGIGKTSWEIGRLLALSERTVVFHLQNASRKLGVCNRQAAVAKAISMGLIGPL
ncbi:helix-turn-helix transcriptional regulator [Pseudomarimonas arenosa]|uniref:LuxR family transcriptional regulator n=1 Tax=Pseudomarimonas arenosa TaxID=2774145 RepID=A0AAW3ZNB4_9GAMM|nr:LuxR family transcriptional regulator [Pseudomarimonas arenosa]MBD8526677.1 LuxR family transcriptional regulator [Pseudomarimonas arenosa]